MINLAAIFENLKLAELVELIKFILQSKILSRVLKIKRWFAVNYLGAH
jgi:hypothetical protein